jgi:hypothetical protein
MIVHICSPATREAEVDGSWFEAILGRVSTRLCEKQTEKEKDWVYGPSGRVLIPEFNSWDHTQKQMKENNSYQGCGEKRTLVHCW